MSQYKKMAGTAAVFVKADQHRASPVERDGMVWEAQELHIEDIPATLLEKPAMANALALEGLEDYDAASHGDKREVTSLGASFVYLSALKGWIELDL